MGVGELSTPRAAAQAPRRGAQATAGRRRGARQGPGPGAVGAGRASLERRPDDLRHAGGGDHQGARRRRSGQGRRRGLIRTDAGADHARGAPPAASAAPPPAAAPTPAPAPIKTTPPGVAPSQVPAPVARASASSATKTIFGVPTPGAAAGAFTPVTQPSPTRPRCGRPVAASPRLPRRRRSWKDRRAQGRRPRSGGPGRARCRRGRSRRDALGFSTPAADAPKRASTPVPAANARARTHRATCRRRNRSGPPPERETPIWTYVGVGITFGLALIGIWQLVGMLHIERVLARPQTFTAARASRTTSSGTGSSRARWPPCWSCRWHAPASRPTR